MDQFIGSRFIDTQIIHKGLCISRLKLRQFKFYLCAQTGSEMITADLLFDVPGNVSQFFNIVFPDIYDE